ncbi:helix-turn-helix domain-containing protein [Granulosicoccus antarcticus]|uniref:HTH-type transcriptional activator Btr n=1 Tax=Granulosicoccus antarcticus IMCC3135 TaxID=1192854 RepID=A0A2Z2NPG7_9GAMM|nr:AraC family transcriptional regulator [Granulosicoccus antarcticus]ASJ72355.1 HTH-type transcriptional activator Btr [Granulosicoccus antarcticus IMCC3135]
MSLAVRSGTSTTPEFELTDGTDRSVHYLEHGFPCPLVRWHYHDDYELHLIVASTGKVFIGDHVGRFGPGHLVLTGPRLPHNWISQTEEVVELRDLVVQFRMNLVSSMAKYAPELSAILPLLERARHGIEFMSFGTEHAEQALRGIRDSSGALRISRLLELLHALAAEQEYVLLSTLAIRSRADQASQDKIQKVTQYISENFSNEITLNDMSTLVGMNDSAFSRFFAKATGNSFIRFVNRVRISKACELLSETKMPITNICYETGFNNVANFNRRFRELKDITPREYRQQSRLRHGARTLGD